MDDSSINVRGTRNLDVVFGFAQGFAIGFADLLFSILRIIYHVLQVLFELPNYLLNLITIRRWKRKAIINCASPK